MKKWLLVACVGIASVLTSCSTEVVATRPNDVVYSRTPAPGPDYIWISGDWIWTGGNYRWQEGRWERRRMNHTWHEGRWQQQKNGYRWRKGHW